MTWGLGGWAVGDGWDLSCSFAGSFVAVLAATLTFGSTGSSMSGKLAGNSSSLTDSKLSPTSLSSVLPRHDIHTTSGRTT